MTKIATDLEQSQQLAKILPIESANMFWEKFGNKIECHVDNHHFIDELAKDNNFDVERTLYPAWSLSALIDVLPDIIEDEDGVVFGLNLKKNYVEYYNPSMGALYATYESVIAEDLVDACVKMIINLNEKGLL